ncbi:DNA-directed RNA polymerase subunit omega [uncultured Helicobacter sp.]|uniref:DNA-directed RNA polymerase subunit omega n=1 Tax=uncultured Helicobacter sp. TaxID=175537 RepID=UPI00374EA66D
MRTEEIAAMALERLDNDRYVLSNLLFARIKELGAGATPLVNMKITKHKLADIAMREIAEGKITLESVESIPTNA